MANVEIERNKINEVSVSFKNISIGKLIAMHNALKAYSQVSTVGYDLFVMLDNHVKQNPDVRSDIHPLI